MNVFKKTEIDYKTKESEWYISEDESDSGVTEVVRGIAVPILQREGSDSPLRYNLDKLPGESKSTAWSSESSCTVSMGEKSKVIASILKMDASVKRKDLLKYPMIDLLEMETELMGKKMDSFDSLASFKKNSERAAMRFMRWQLSDIGEDTAL